LSTTLSISAVPLRSLCIDGFAREARILVRHAVVHEWLGVLAVGGTMVTRRACPPDSEDFGRALNVVAQGAPCESVFAHSPRLSGSALRERRADMDISGEKASSCRKSVGLQRGDA